MHLLNRDSRDFGPSLICVRVVIEKLVAQHQSYGQEAVFAAWLSLYRRVGELQAIYEEQGQENHVLCDLRGCENCRHPFPKARSGDGIW